MPTVPGWSEDDLEGRATDLAALLRRAWRAVARVVAASLGGKTTLDSVQGTQSWTDEVDHVVLGFVRDTYLDAAGDVTEALGGDLPLVGDDLVKSYLLDARNRLVNTSDEVWATVRAQLALGNEAGESPQELAQRVRNVTGVSPGRALTIARTEVHAAHEAGTYAQALYVDPTATKRWLATKDDKTRPTHAAMLDSPPVPLGGMFTVGGSALRFPGDPEGPPDETINCRCSVAYDFDIITAVSTSDEVTKVPALAASAGKWKPEVHPRGKDGKFIKAGFVQALLAAKTPYVSQVLNAVDALNAAEWGNLKSEQQQYIHDAVAKLPPGSVAHAVAATKLEKLKPHDVGVPGGPSPVAGHKGAPPGTPTKVSTTLAWGKHADGAVILETVSGGYRVVWNGQTKKYDYQQQVQPSGSWTTKQSLTKKDFYEQNKKVTHWVVPGGKLATATPAVEKIAVTAPSAASVAVDITPTIKSNELTLAQYMTFIGKTNHPVDNVIARSPSGEWRVISVGDGQFSQQKLDDGGKWTSVGSKTGRLSTIQLLRTGEWNIPSDAPGLPSTSKTPDVNTPAAPSVPAVAVDLAPVSVGSAEIFAALGGGDDGHVLATTTTGVGVPLRATVWNSTAGKRVRIQKYSETHNTWINLGSSGDETAFNKDWSFYDWQAGPDLHAPVAPAVVPAAVPSPAGSVLSDVPPVSFALTDGTPNWDAIDSAAQDGELEIGQIVAETGNLGAGQYRIKYAGDNSFDIFSRASLSDTWHHVTSADSSELQHEAGNWSFLDNWNGVGGPVAGLAPQHTTAPGALTNPNGTPNWSAIESAHHAGDFPDGTVIAQAVTDTGEPRWQITAQNNELVAQYMTVGGSWAYGYSDKIGSLPEIAGMIPSNLTWHITPASPTINVEPPASSTLPSAGNGDISGISDFTKTKFKTIFKGASVGYWSKPEKIWDTVKAVQAIHPDLNNPGHSKYTPLQILKALDAQLKTKESAPFETKMMKWAASAKGKAYVGQDVTLTPSPTTPSTPTASQIWADLKNQSPGAVLATGKDKFGHKYQLVESQGSTSNSHYVTVQSKSLSGAWSHHHSVLTEQSLVNELGNTGNITWTIDVTKPSSTVSHVTGEKLTGFPEVYDNVNYGNIWKTGAKVSSAQVIDAVQSSNPTQVVAIHKTGAIEHRVISGPPTDTGLPVFYVQRRDDSTTQGWQLVDPPGEMHTADDLKKNFPGKVWRSAHNAVVTPSASKSAPPVIPVAGKLNMGGGDISHLPDTKKQQLYQDFKKQPATYLTSPPGEIFAALKTIGDDEGISLQQMINVVDEIGAKKVGQADAHLFDKKIKDWLKTPKGAAMASGVPLPKPPTPSFSAGIEPNTQLPSFEQSSGLDYKITPVSSTSALWSKFTAAHGGDWTASQKSALKTYTGGTYYSVNAYLYGTLDDISTTNEKVLRQAQLGMRRSTTPLLLHRGVGFDGIGHAHNHADLEKKVGQTWKSEGFTSTSVGGHAAFSGKPVLVEIEAPPGTPMAWIKPVSQYPSENEMLLAAGLSYRIISVKKVGGKSVVRVRVVREEAA